MSESAQILEQLNAARNICLASPAHYSQVVPGVLGVIGPQAHLDLRRWGSDFLAETFASPVLSADDKQKLSLSILDTLKGFLNRKEDAGEEEDPAVVKSAVQCAASIYPLVFRHTLSSQDTADVWAKMAGIKSSILRTMDNVAPGIRICGIKFISRVVQVQTPGLIADPRRPEQNEISLALLSRDHPVLQPNQLEAEASGLLDRLLGVLQDNSADALIVTATLNSLSALVHRRASISNKILTTVLAFNPLSSATNGVAHLGGAERIALKSMTRTTMSFLVNVLKRNPSHAFAGRLQQRTEQLRHSLAEVFSEAGSGKRPAQDEPTDGLNSNKRMRIEQHTTNGTTPQMQQEQRQTPWPPPLPSGPVSYRELFTLNPDPNASGFHVEAIPIQIVNQLLPPLLQSIDPGRLNAAIITVQKRLLELRSRNKQGSGAVEAARAATGMLEEEDHYDPLSAVAIAGDEAQVLNRMDQMPSEDGDVLAGPVKAFELPPSPPLTEDDVKKYSRLAVNRVFGTLSEIDRAKATKKAGAEEKGFNRVVPLSQDRDGWMTLLTRIATRATAGLNGNGNEIVKKEGEESTALIKKGANQFNLSNGIRNAILDYVTTDFRRRIGVAIAWLNEEWYSDRLAYSAQHPDSTSKPSMAAGDLSNYATQTLRTLDTVITYLDAKDLKVLIRFVSEIPEIDGRVLEKVRKVADDPERVALAVASLQYLAMYRPPVREAALDEVERLWREGGDASVKAEKVLVRWRPGVVSKGGDAGEGVKAEVKADRS